MIPKDILDKHILAAVDRIEREGVPATRKSVHYDLVVKGFRCPPKLVISLAYEAMSGRPFPSTKFNAVEAKNHFQNRGYTVIDRREEALLNIATEDDESSFAEGEAKYKMHRSYERDIAISKRAKAVRLAETERLECEVCGFDFHAVYGEIGLGYIEAHHKIPVSELGATKKTKIEDLALVCSNCHRILHRYKPMKSVNELRDLLGETIPQ